MHKSQSQPFPDQVWRFLQFFCTHCPCQPNATTMRPTAVALVNLCKFPENYVIPISAQRQTDGRRAGLKIRWWTGQAFAKGLQSFGAARPSLPSARSPVVPRSISGPSSAAIRRIRARSTTALATKSISTRLSGSGFEGRPCRSPRSPRLNDRERVSTSRATTLRSIRRVDQTDAREPTVRRLGRSDRSKLAQRQKVGAVPVNRLCARPPANAQAHRPAG